jgi:Trk K+ transport system NAD-binding subunit
MLTVYKVDNDTRLILPNSQWGNQVLESLAQQGHLVEITGDDPDLCARTEAELARRDQLLAETGL